MSALFAQYVKRAEADIDLAIAALLIALDAYPGLNITRYVLWLDAQGYRARERLDPGSSPSLNVSELNRLVFDDLGFHANAENYYDPANSYLNDVIERRTGIPITLSLVYMEIATRARLRVEGVGLPGHFIVRLRGDDWERLVDPFNRGIELTHYDCEQLLTQVYGKPMPLLPEYLQPIGKRAFLTRMLTNLQTIHLQQQQWPQAHNAISNILCLRPERPLLGDLIRARGLVNYKLQNWNAAEQDWLRYLTLAPNASDSALIRDNIEALRNSIARRN